MADVGDSVSNPQSPVNGILDDPLTLDFDPMSFQLPSSPTEPKAPPLDVDSSPEDPPFINEPSAANDTNYKYNPKSYLLDLDSIEQIQATIQSPSDLASPDSENGPEVTPDLLVDLRQGGGTPRLPTPEEDPEDLSDPKTDEDDNSKELDLSAGSESTSSFVAECLSPTTGVVNSHVDTEAPGGERPDRKDPSPVPDGRRTYDLQNSVEDVEPFEDNLIAIEEMPSSPVKEMQSSSPVSPPHVKSPIPAPTVSSPGKEHGPSSCEFVCSPTAADMVEVPLADSQQAPSPQEEVHSPPHSPYTVSSPIEETDSTATPSTYREATREDHVQSPLDKPWSPALDVSDMELELDDDDDDDTPSPTPLIEEPVSLEEVHSEDVPGGESTDQRSIAEELTEPVFTSTYTCMSAVSPDSSAAPTDTVIRAVHENGTVNCTGSEDEDDECCKGKSRRDASKSSQVTSKTTTKEGGKMIVEEHSTCKVEVSKQSAYDALNGLSDRNDKNAYQPPDMCIRENEANNAFREVAVTGISLVSLKSQYEQSVAEHESVSPSREIINTGVDIETLKCSYTSPVNGYSHEGRDTSPCTSPCDDLVPVDIELLKSSFNNHSDVVRTTPLEEVRVDKAKLQKKFDKLRPEDSSSTCKRCAALVYPVERVKAEKNSYHKNCFRCTECNKLLSIDTYQSHESEIYCRVHFKQLFQPKVRFDNDAGPRRQRRNEMIIRENVPEELPPDVVRCGTKLDDGLGHLSLDLRNIKQQFETPHEFVPSVSDRSALARSESLVKRLEKYQCAAAGERNGTVDSSGSGEEDEGDPSVTKHGKAKEKVVVFEGLSTLKSQWETGRVSGHQEEREDVKEELAKLRKKMCLGRSESMRQVYQKAVEDANRTPVSARTEAVTLDGQEVKATSIKEKIEAGVLHRETEAEKMERLAREKQEELSVFGEAGIAHEAKNIFKQLDAEVAKQSTTSTPTSLARSPSNRWNQPKAQSSPAEVVRSSDPVREVEVETTELSERFKFFENYKEGSKERKRFEITPPREIREPSPDVPVRHDPNVVRALDAPEEVVVTDTARRMRERFRELEESAGRREVPAGPKPLKRITPPRDYTVDDREESPEVQRDPAVVQCSYKVDDDVVVEADRAKSMRARFENWEAAVVARENGKNGAAEDDEEECLPMADTAKNLRAKFEAIKDDTVRQEAERRKAKVNRFVEFPGTPTTETCNICSKKLYPMERMEASGLRLHKNCFRCSHCSCHLRLENYTVSGGKLFCTPHFRQFFIAKGNYDEGFGREKWSRSTSPASREANEEYATNGNARLNVLDQPVTA